MREIKFRGKREDIGWKYGYLTCIEHRTLTDWEQRPAIRPFDEPFITYGVDPNSVGQYTGLKDKNGKEIYEGDIVRGKNGWQETVLLDNYGLMLYLKEISNNLKVIGNIWENPELKEGK